MAYLFLLFYGGNLIFAEGDNSVLLISDKSVSDSTYLNSNLQPYKNDEVRGSVFSLNNMLEMAQFENSNDSVLSFACWLRPLNINSNPGTVFGKDSTFYFRYLSNGKIQFNHYLQHDLNSKELLCEDTWQHIGFTLSNNGALKIYYNGIIVAGDSIASGWWKRNGSYLFGMDPYQIATEGFIDEIRLWNKLLSPSAMDSLFRATRINPPLSYRMLLYLPFDEGLDDFTSGSVKISENGDFVLVTENTRAGLRFLSDSAYFHYSPLSFGMQQTIALWVKPKLSSKPQALVGNSDFVLRYIPSTGELWYSVPLQFGLRSVKTVACDNEWVHLAVSVSFNHEISFFINGEFIGSEKIANKSGNVNYLEIGRSIWGNSFNGMMSELAIWNRALSSEEIKEVYLGKLKTIKFEQQKKWPYWLILAIVVVILFALFYLFFILKRTSISHAQVKKETFELPEKNAFYFMSTFSVYDRQGNNISAEFTPTVMRIFALIYLYPKINGKNITSLILSDLLWPNLEVSQQKNSRNANIHKLRNSLEKVDGISLEFDRREWVLKSDAGVFIDLAEYENIIAYNDFEIPFRTLALDKHLLYEGLGNLLQQYNDKRIDFLSSRSSLMFENNQYEKLQKISTLWLSIDTLSDEALRFGIYALNNLNRRESALHLYHNFVQNYQALLNEVYPQSFSDLSRFK